MLLQAASIIGLSVSATVFMLDEPMPNSGKIMTFRKAIPS